MIQTHTIEDVLAKPIDKLEQVLAADFPGHEREWAQGVGNALTEVGQALGLHTALAETADGLLTKVDLTRPTSVRQVSELRRQHSELQQQTRSLQADLQTAAQAFQAPHASLSKVEALPEPVPLAPVPDFGSIRQAIAQLSTALHQHQQEETKLLQDSVNTDIGVGD
jgi:phage-related tail protein